MHPFPAIFPRLPLLPDSSPATSCLRNVTGAPLPEPILSSSLSRVVSIRSSSPESLPMRGSSPRRDRVPASALALSSSKTPAPVRMVNSIVSHARRYCLGSVACAPPMRSSPHLPNTKNQLDPLVWQITAVAVLGSLMGQVDATVVNVSLSSLAVDLHCSLTTIQWVTSGYLLALALMLPLNGWLVGQLGAKSLYLWCFPIFTLSSALCGLAWSANSLIGFRILQGMSGGLMAPLAQMMIVRAAGRHTARVFGYAAIPILLGPLLGPVLAGAILQHASWRWLFLVNVPVGLLGILLAIRFLPEDRAEARPRDLDVVGFCLLSPGLVLFLYAMDHVSERIGLTAFLVALVLLTVFIRAATRRGDDALIDLQLFRGKDFSASVLTQFTLNGISFAGQMLIPIMRRVTQRGRLVDGSSRKGMICTYPKIGVVTQRLGLRRVAGSGAFLALAGTLPFLFLASHGMSLPL